MIIIRKLLFIVGVALVFGSCQDMDPRLFNNKPLDEYQYDQYESEFDPLPEEFALIDGELNPFEVESEGYKIYGAYVGDLSTIDQDTVIVYCHGNSAHLDAYFQRVMMLYNLGQKSQYGVAIFDYKGFGKSEGEPTEDGLIEDTHAVLEYLKSLGLSDDRTIIYGFSLGSIPAVAVSADSTSPLHPAKLILEAPIGSIDAMTSDGSGLSMPSSFFTYNNVNNIEEIKNVEQPFLLFHGVHDDFLSFSTHGEPIYINYEGEHRDSIQVWNGNHGDLPYVYGIEKYINNMYQFISKTH